MAGPLQLVKLEQVLIFPQGAGDDYLDITSRVLEINVFDDLFYPNLYGHLTLGDHMAIRQHLPIQSGERVRIIWSVPWSKDSQIIHNLRVANLSDHQVHEGKLESYNLALITEARYQSDLSRQSKLYSGTIVDVCNQVWNDADMPVDLLFTSPSVGKINFLPAWWTAFQSLNYITRHHTTETKSMPVKDLIFHDYGNEAIMMRLSDLFRNQPIRDYTYSELPNPDQHYQIIEYQKYNHSGLWLTRNLSDGLLNRDSWHYDVTNKTIVRNNFNYLNWFSTQPHLNPYPHMRGSSIGPVSMVDGTYATENESHQFDACRDMLIKWLQSETIHIKICGDSKLRSGAIVNCLIPLVDYTSKNDERQSGKWLVTSIRHVVKRESYHCYVELSLPGLNVPLPVQKTIDI